MLKPLYFFNELRIKLGVKDAIHIFLQLRIKKAGRLNVSYLKHPIKLRAANGSDIATFKEVIVRKDYDFETKFSPKYIIDAGANIGLTSVFFANKFPEAEIIAIEPDADNFNYLQKNTSYYKRVKSLHSAIWFESTYLKVIDEGRGSDGFVVKEVAETDNNSFRAISIEEIIKQNGWVNIDILKIDVEGSEKEIFSSGYEKWLPKTKILVVEIHDRFRPGCSKALFTAINQYNFSCVIKGYNMIFENLDLLNENETKN